MGQCVFHHNCRPLSGGSRWKSCDLWVGYTSGGCRACFERIRRIVRRRHLQCLAMMKCRHSMWLELTKRKMHFQHTEIQPHFQSQQAMECHPRNLNRTFQDGGKQARPRGNEGFQVYLKVLKLQRPIHIPRPLAAASRNRGVGYVEIFYSTSASWPDLRSGFLPLHSETSLLIYSALWKGLSGLARQFTILDNYCGCPSESLHGGLSETTASVSFSSHPPLQSKRCCVM